MRVPFARGVIFRGERRKKSDRAIDCAIEAARQGQTVQATRIALGPNRVFGRYVDVTLAWGVIGRSNGIAHPDTIERFFAVPLQAAGIAQQGRRYVLEDVDAIDGAEVATVKPIKVFLARFVDDIAVDNSLLVERPRVRMQVFALGVIFGWQIPLASFEAGEQGANVLPVVLDIVAGGSLGNTPPSGRTPCPRNPPKPCSRSRRRRGLRASGRRAT